MRPLAEPSRLEWLALRLELLGALLQLGFDVAAMKAALAEREATGKNKPVAA